MADYNTPGEFTGTIGSRQDLWSLNVPSGQAVRPAFVLASPTSSVGTLELFQLSNPPATSAYAFPTFAQQFGTWNINTLTSITQSVGVSVGNFPATQAVSGTVTANQGGAPWSVTFPSAQLVDVTDRSARLLGVITSITQSVGVSATIVGQPISTSRTWSLTSSGDSVTAHLDAPVTLSVSTVTTEPLFTDKFASGSTFTTVSAGATIASVIASVVGTYDISVAVGTDTGGVADFANTALYINSTLISNLSNPVAGVVQTQNFRYPTSSTTDTFYVNAINAGTKGVKYAATISGIRVK